MASGNDVSANLDPREEFDYTMPNLYMTGDSGYYSLDPACPDVGFEDSTFLTDQNQDERLGLNPSEVNQGQKFLHAKQSILSTSNDVDIREHHNGCQVQHGHFDQTVAIQDLDLGLMQLPVRPKFSGLAITE